MTTLLLAWTPARTESDTLIHLACVLATEHNRRCAESYGERFDPGDPRNATVRAGWSTGPRKKDIEIGDRVFMLVVGESRWPRDIREHYALGIVRSGHVVGVMFDRPYNNPDDPRPVQPYVDVVWDVAVSTRNPLPTSLLMDRIPQKNWLKVQRGGDQLDEDVAAEVERLWTRHVLHV
jgi:hypothetical protein